jgi:hypothetical protein
MDSDLDIIRRPADNIVLEFIELNDLRRKCIVKSTADPNRFRVSRGLSALNHVVNTTFMTLEEVKGLYVDMIVNNFECVKNEIFMRGLLSCVPEKQLEPYCIDCAGNEVPLMISNDEII